MDINNNSNTTIELLIEFLFEYKRLFTELADISVSIEKNSKDCYMSFYKKNLHEIQPDIDKYNQNCERSKKINDESTLAVGSWYDFVKNPEEISKLTFPLHFIRHRKQLKKSIKSLHEELSSILIENRFIAEQVTIWEHRLETEVIRSTRESEVYALYEKTETRLESVTSDLKYLIPSIPGLCPADIYPAGIDSLIEKLRCFEAA